MYSTACLILLQLQLNNEDMWIFLAVAIFKNQLLKFADTIEVYIFLSKSNPLKNVSLSSAVLETDRKLAFF